MVSMFNDYVEHSLTTWTETPVQLERFEALVCFSPDAFVARRFRGFDSQIWLIMSI